MNECKSCNEPLSGHKIGRRLDVCVARAMGWTEIQLGRGTLNTWTGIPPSGSHWRGIPHYSTDIRDAMEALQNKKHPYEIRSTPPSTWTKYKGGVFVKIAKDRQGDTIGWYGSVKANGEYKETAFTICKALLELATMKEG